jgi:hypothetical protein
LHGDPSSLTKQDNFGRTIPKTVINLWRPFVPFVRTPVPLT